MTSQWPSILWVPPESIDAEIAYRADADAIVIGTPLAHVVRGARRTGQLRLL